jgi:hypothetical protein
VATAEPLLVAHRAGNDPALVGPALAAGADLVEADVHVARGRLELRHEKALGPLPLHWDRWYVRRPRDRPVALEDVLAAAPRGTAFLLDLKGPSPRLAGLVRRAVRVHASGPVWVCSRTWSHLHALRGDDDLRVLRSIGSRVQLARFGTLRRPGDAVAIRARLLEAGMAGPLADVPTVLAWGATDLATAQRLLAGGASGLILDDLALIARLSS